MIVHSMAGARTIVSVGHPHGMKTLVFAALELLYPAAWVAMVPVLDLQ